MNTWSYLILIAALLLLAAVMLYARFATRSREKSLHHAPGEPTFPNETISATRHSEIETSRINLSRNAPESRPEIRVDRITGSLAPSGEAKDGSKKQESDYFDELQDAAAGLAMLMRSSPVRRSEPMIFAPEEVEAEVEADAASEVEAVVEAEVEATEIEAEAEVEAVVEAEATAEVEATELEAEVEATEVDADVAAVGEATEVEAAAVISEREPEVELIVAGLELARECSAGSGLPPFNRAALILAQSGEVVLEKAEGSAPAALLESPQGAQIVVETIDTIDEIRVEPLDEREAETAAEPLSVAAAELVANLASEPITGMESELLSEPVAATAQEEFEVSLPVEVRVLTTREILGEEVCEKIDQIDKGLDALEQLVRSLEANLQALDSVDLLDVEEEMAAAAEVIVSAAA